MAISSEEFNTWASKQKDIAINKAEYNFFRYINSLSKDIGYFLSDIKRVDNLSKPKIDKLIQEVVSLSNTRYEDAVRGLSDDAARLAIYSGEIERIGLGMAASAADVAVIASRTPIAANGLLFSEHLDTLVAYNNKRLADTLRVGWSRKVDMSEISGMILGTERVKLADGLMYKSKVSSRASIDTAMHHFAEIGKAETWKANDVYKYRIVATLDRRTSSTCRELDSKVFTYGAPDARVPPFHYFCRTVIIPELDKEYSWLSEGRTRSSAYGSVDSNISYNEWAKQNADKIAEQDEIDRQKRNSRAKARRKDNS